MRYPKNQSAWKDGNFAKRTVQPAGEKIDLRWKKSEDSAAPMNF